MRPPPSSRSYRTADKINAERHFSLDVYLDKITPYPELLEPLRKAAAAMTPYDVDRGNRAPFPSALDFVDASFGIKPRDKAAKLTRDTREWSVRLLRAAYKLRQYVNEREWEEVHVRCYKCRKDSIRCRVGKLEPLGDEHPRVVAIEVECDCKKFVTGDFYEIEAKALSELL